MSEPRDNRIPIMMSDAEVKAIDDWRFENRISTRSEAIRRLSQRGLLHERLLDAVIRSGDTIAAALKDDPSAAKMGIDFLDSLSELGVDIKRMRELEAAIAAAAERAKPKKKPKPSDTEG